MRVVFAMALHAGRRELEVGRIPRDVALFASERAVRANQRIIGLTGVIETPLQPTPCIVAALAFRVGAEMTLVVVLVTGAAGGRQP